MIFRLKKIKASKDEMEKMVWNKLWIARSRSFKMKEQDIVLWSNNLSNLFKLLFGVYFKL